MTDKILGFFRTKEEVAFLIALTVFTGITLFFYSNYNYHFAMLWFGIALGMVMEDYFLSKINENNNGKKKR